ncbi:hypothetical protein CPB83DRAFT_897732 [Crepidotus variabilis]|uniref:Uncharacterized protein n=1 Tax=Crepidotus variabilis TaxID=179855 RepID=A0A9P6JLA7_9AGAR|nr:hypothetical protein CPB83DRAFT_897732 [Crepidotus variabilis]
MKQSTRRTKAVFLTVNPQAPETTKKKTNGNASTDMGAHQQLRKLEHDLRCAEHPGPNRWCFVSHQELSLWAQKVCDDRAKHVCVVSAPKKNTPDIHVHINNAPSADDSRHITQSQKRSCTPKSASESDLDIEPLPLSEVINNLHLHYPLLDLPQYPPALKKKGIVYANSVSTFPRDFYVGSGMAEGAVGPFLAGVRKARKNKKEKHLCKCSHISDKENVMVAGPSCCPLNPDESFKI